MEIRKCENCRYWRQIENAMLPGNIEYLAGQCRRYAPHLLSGSGTGYYIHSLWAVTSSEDWCGEFREKDNPDPTVESQQLSLKEKGKADEA